MENIQLDIPVISNEPTAAVTPLQATAGDSTDRDKPRFSEVLTEEQSVEEANPENSNASQNNVADGNSLPGEHAGLPREDLQKAGPEPLLSQSEIKITAPPQSGNPEQALAAETIPAAGPSEATTPAPEVAKAGDPVANAVEQTADNDLQVSQAIWARPAESSEKNPTVANSLAVSVIGAENNGLTEPVVLTIPQQNAATEAVFSATPITQKPPMRTDEPVIQTAGSATKNNNSMEMPKTVSAERITAANPQQITNTLPNAELLPEDSAADLSPREPVKPDTPMQTPIARAMVKEFADIQSNTNTQTTGINDSGIKLADIQAASARIPAPQTGNTPTTPLQPLNLDRPGWEQSFANNVSWMNNEKVQTANIRISPAELGPIEIKISVKQDQLTLNITSHHAVTRETLENAIPRLREMLAGSGFESVNVDVSSQGQNGQQGNKRATTDPEGFEQSGNFAAESEQELDERQQSGTQISMRGTGMVDIFA